MKEEVVTIPFVAYESSMNRMERIIKGLIAIIIVLIICFTIYLLIPTEEEVIEDTTQSVSDIDNGSSVNQIAGE